YLYLDHFSVLVEVYHYLIMFFGVVYLFIKEHGVLGGGNTRVRATDEHVFFNHQKIEKFNIVSTPQLIIDLLEEGGPSEEAGAHLLERFHGD
ncbi:hypothetical protein AKJ57_02150, partial [candidate division MSBL1 archaeon SCGC-AAA259A05]